MASCSSPYRGRGRLHSSSHGTRSRTRLTVLPCYVSVSYSVASAGSSLGSSGGLWSTALRWAIPASRPCRSSSFASAYRMRSIARFYLGLKVYRRRARRATSRCISRPGHPPNTPACHVPSSDAGRWASFPAPSVFAQAVAHVSYLTSLCSLCLLLPLRNQVQCYSFVTLYSTKDNLYHHRHICCCPSAKDSVLHAIHVHVTCITTAFIFTICI